MRILLAEDDALLGDGLTVGLRQLGFVADWVRDGIEARNALKGDVYEALILDLGLPRQDGFSLLQQLRREGSELPILVLTARDGKEDKLSGFDAGADDYLVKPVDLDELAARLRALVRRSRGRATDILSVGRVSLDTAARRVHLDGQVVDLSGKELGILELLMEQAGRVVSRTQLENALYGWGEGVESNALEVHIHHLRRKLGSDFIRTLRGIGYLVEKDPAA